MAPHQEDEASILRTGMEAESALENLEREINEFQRDVTTRLKQLIEKYHRAPSPPKLKRRDQDALLIDFESVGQMLTMLNDRLSREQARSRSRWWFLSVRREP